MRHWKKLSASGLKMYEIKDCHLKNPKQTKHKKYQANKQTTTKKKKKERKTTLILLYYIILYLYNKMPHYFSENNQTLLV